MGCGVVTGLTMKHERLLRLEETARERKLKLTDEQIELLERFIRLAGHSHSRKALEPGERENMEPWV